MAPAKSYKLLIRQFSIVLFIILALYFALMRPLTKQSLNLLEGQIEDAASQLETYLSQNKDEFLPTQEALAALEGALERDEKNYQILKNFLDPPQEYLPQDTQEAGLYFIEQLHIASKRLKRQANTLKIKVPEGLGFSEEMPADKESVELLLKELDTVERAATMLMEQGVQEISLVKPLRAQEQREEKTQQLFYRELPIQLSFFCDSAALVKILYQIKNFSPVLVVKDIIVKKTDGASLQIEMLLSRLALS